MTISPSLRPILGVLAAIIVISAVVVVATMSVTVEPLHPTPVPTLPPAPAATPTAVAGRAVRAGSIPALLTALADDSITDITVANGTYHVSAAGLQMPDSLWIGAAFAGRTRPVTVRAETPGGVTIDGGGEPYFGGISFDEGAHDQTWEGFVFANGTPTETGVITFGGYSGMVAAHHITLRNLTFLSSLTGSATTTGGPSTDHAIYVSKAAGGPHDLVFEDITVDGRGGLGAIHFFSHVRRQPECLERVGPRVDGDWDPAGHHPVGLHPAPNIVIDHATVTDALSYGVRYEDPGSDIFLANVTTTGSGRQGFHSSMGSNPPGIVFIGDTLE